MNEKKTLLVQYKKNRKINGDILTDFFYPWGRFDQLFEPWGRFDQFGDVLTRGRFD